MSAPLNEEALRFIMESTWAEATATVAKKARETAAFLPAEIDGRTALLALAETIEKINLDRLGGQA